MHGHMRALLAASMLGVPIDAPRELHGRERHQMQHQQYEGERAQQSHRRKLTQSAFAVRALAAEPALSGEGRAR